MAAVKGVAGKILSINLSDKTSRVEQVPEEIYRRYLSGLGLAVRILYDRIPAGANALGPENILGFVGGVLTATGALFAGRFLVAGKSPLTGGWGDANCGGNLAPLIKRSGYDGIFIEGCALEPVYVYIDNEHVEVLPAADLWGKDTVETEDLLIERHGNRARVACIGPAGENLVRFAGIANDHGRLAGRSGLGAVMGSKRLKALVLNGKNKIEVADSEAIKNQGKVIAQLMPRGSGGIPPWLVGPIGWLMSKLPVKFRIDGLMSLPSFSQWGTAAGNEVCIATGDASVRNWRGYPTMYPMRAVGLQKIIPTQQKKYHCVACPLGCGSICKLNGSDRQTHRPEYETVAGFGPNLLNRDLDTIFQLNETCNRMGLDSISTSSVVGFAMDCYEKGLIDAGQTGGLELKWGNPKAIVRLVEMIVRREGIGDLLAEGVKIASEQIGEASRPYAFHAGGQELPYHNPRIDPAYGVFYVSDPTPGRHTVSSSTEYEMFAIWRKVSWVPEVPQQYSKNRLYENSPENAKINAAGALYKALIDCAGVCLFGAHLGADRLGLFEMLNAAFGFSYTPDEYMEIGRRLQTLRQQFNLKHGIIPADVCLPPILYGDPPAKKGPAKGLYYDLTGMRSNFWREMGWDEKTGAPLKEIEESI